MFVISCCQLAEDGLTPRIPSVILVNAHGTEGDPVDDFAKRLVADDHCEPPKVYDTGACPWVEPRHALKVMEDALLQRDEFIGTGSYGAKELRSMESVFFDAQRTRFGCGSCRPYATAWQDKFGLLSKRNCRVILRLESGEDRLAFHRDVVRESAKLVRPLGYGPGLRVMEKQFGVSGGIGLDLWDADFAQGVVNLPLPILVLPHATTSPLKLPDATLLAVFTSSLHHAMTGPIQEPDNFVPGPWFTYYAAQLRKRLRHLPGDYEHTLQRLARQLFPACLGIVAHAGRLSKTKLREIEALALDLCAHALRGLTLSMAGLAWHGLGLDHGCPQEEVVRVLANLR